ncbi:MAG: tetratricopeptide repeat protein [Bacteroidales bacterium]|nr:tetratricopeptide repeat protein [Bacteroidales bacterium]MCF8390814.1 tetratricopeptide repeat protein [Bacteroidales bacterium]
MIVFKNKNTIALLVIMGAIAFCGLLITYIYYKNINDSVDPRILEARTLYEKYNGYAQENEYEAIFSLMDSIESIYHANLHYKDSYETGVLHNNRAAAYLTMALYSTDIDSLTQDSLFDLAEISANNSIEIYLNWLELYQHKTIQEIQTLITNDFYVGLEKYDAHKKAKFLKSRLKEIIDSQKETERRLSVSYTNLGIIYRHKLNYEMAANSYLKALELWENNLTAENNLNALLGRAQKKRTMLQKLFPPEK